MASRNTDFDEYDNNDSGDNESYGSNYDNDGGDNDGAEGAGRGAANNAKSKNAKNKKKDKFVMPVIKTVSDRDKALEAAIKNIEEQFGKGSVMKFGQKRIDDVPVVPTGSLRVDIALGVGGLPRGRIIEIYGPESSGKTTLALHCVAEVQKRGGICGYIDAEHALDPVYAKNLGVNIDELYISQPDSGEQGLEICQAMVTSGAIDLVIVDSVAALTPQAELDGNMGDSHMGLHARLMSQALRKLTGVINKMNCTVIFINQLRDKIGGYGGGETTTGGRALRFYASVRIDIRKEGESLKDGGDYVGNRTKVKIAKNKVAPPFKVTYIDIMFGKGISHSGDVLELAADEKIVAKSGNWFSYKDIRLGNGRENAKNYLDEHPELCEEIENAVRKQYGLPDLESLNKQLRFLTNDEAAAEEKPAKAKGKAKAKDKKAESAETEAAAAENTAEIAAEPAEAEEEELKFED